MKKIFFIPSVISIFLSFSMFAQDTIFYDAERKETLLPANAVNFTVTGTSDLPKGVEAVVSRYDITGQILNETFYRNLKKKTITGQRTSWTKEGIKRMQASYEKGKLHGNLITYWDGVKIKRKDYYQKGKFKYGNVWDIHGNEVEFFPLEVKAQFPGGQSAMQKYLKENINPPRNLTGRVVVKLKIDKTGKLSVEEITGDKIELKLEALRVIDTMPKWEPAFHDGNPINCLISLPLVFAHQ